MNDLIGYDPTEHPEKRRHFRFEIVKYILDKQWNALASVEYLRDRVNVIEDVCICDIRLEDPKCPTSQA